MNVYKVLRDSDVFSNIRASEFYSKYEARIVIETLTEVALLDPSFFDKFCAYILLNNGVRVTSWEVNNDCGSKQPVYIIFDEHGRIPLELLHGDSIVFHAHLNFGHEDRQYPNLFDYPLGCNSFVPEKPFTPFGQRRINVFFSGNLHAGRRKLYQQLIGIPFLPLRLLTKLQRMANLNFDNKWSSSYIRFTDGFSKGLSFDAYSEYLYNSKIILSPSGISNSECFRHYEGLRAGCVVVTEKIPAKPQLSGSPIIEVKDWSSGFDTISELLKDPAGLDKLGKDSYNWYRDHISPRPLAKYIINSVKTLI
ncbi:MAG: hypothetical protein WKF87_11000 [Chryseolinea sp.]